MSRAPARSARVVAAPLACLAFLLLSGCGGGGAASTPASLSSSGASHVLEPLTHEQALVEKGARLVVSDGCSACHLAPAGSGLGPSFASFAGRSVTLADGRHVLVDEHFLREALLQPATSPIRGYDAAPMLAAVKRVQLSSHPSEVAALAAFIEQIGPE